MKKALTIGGMAAVAFAIAGWSVGHSQDRPSIAPPAGSPLGELISGYHFRTPETQALQDDDFINPGFLWVENGAELWEVADGAAGKSCATCHGDAEDAMKGVGARYPVYSAAAGKPINLEQRINLCRSENMQAEPWRWESPELLAMTAFVRHQSRGMPVTVAVDGPMQPFFEAGRDFYYQRRGQLDMSCANCHEVNYGMSLRADMLSQGHSNGFPTYRLKWQGIGSLHRRFRGCNEQVRANRQDYGAEDYVNLELYLAWRGMGLPVETPAVRQ